MAYDEDLRPCHGLSKEGKASYEKMLERKADEILFKHEHPFKWFVQKFILWKGMQYGRKTHIEVDKRSNHLLAEATR